MDQVVRHMNQGSSKVSVFGCDDLEFRGDPFDSPRPGPEDTSLSFIAFERSMETGLESPINEGKSQL